MLYNRTAAEPPSSLPTRTDISLIPFPLTFTSTYILFSGTGGLGSGAQLAEDADGQNNKDELSFCKFNPSLSALHKNRSFLV